LQDSVYFILDTLWQKRKWQQLLFPSQLLHIRQREVFKQGQRLKYSKALKDSSNPHISSFFDTSSGDICLTKMNGTITYGVKSIDRVQQ
jgi:hypothetical protein